MHQLPGPVDHHENQLCLAARDPLKGVGGGDPIPHPAVDAGSLGLYVIVWDVRLTAD